MRRGTVLGATALCAAVGAAPAAAVEVRTADDHLAIIVEAEEYVSRDERWVPTDATTDPTAEQQPDPDGNHSAGASGGTYLELLPDNRIDHTTPVPAGAPRYFWSRPGTGPLASYAVDFPEPGRYAVHLRAFTTGTEDNGIHVGLNGEWPESGKELQLCTASENDWRWSDRQRDSGGVPCGIPGTLWLTVEEAGPATLSVSAREDGFEFDRLMLIKDLSDNTRRCAPVADLPDSIACREGGTETADGFVDLELSLESSSEEGTVGDLIELDATIGNRDRFDTASEVALVLAAAADDWRLVEADEGCERDGDAIVCAVGEVAPGPVDEDTRFALTLEALREDLLRIELSATASESDDSPDNDGETLLVEIGAAPVLPTELVVEFGGLPGMSVPGADTVLEFSVTNTGPAEARDARIALTVPDGLDAGTPPDECMAVPGAAATTFDCLVGPLGAGQSRGFALSVSSGSEGDYAIGARASASNAPSTDAAASLDVSDPERPDEGDGEGDGGGAASGGDEDGGGTTTDGADTGGTTTDGTDAGGTDADGTDADGTDAGGTDAGGTDAGGSGADGTATGERTVTVGAGAGPLFALLLAIAGGVRRRGARRPA